MRGRKKQISDRKGEEEDKRIELNCIEMEWKREVTGEEREIGGRDREERQAVRQVRGGTAESA